VVTVPNLIAVGQTLEAYVQISAGQIGSLALFVSRSLKFIGTDRDRSGAYDFM